MIVTERLVARRWTMDDGDLAWALWGDPEVTRRISRRPLTRVEVQARLEVQVRSELQYWPFFERADGPFVGCAGLKHVEEPFACVELGFHLVRAAWGRGFASEMGAGVLEQARELGLNRVHAGHHPDNVASRRVLEKLGFVYLRDSFFAPTGLDHPFYERVL